MRLMPKRYPFDYAIVCAVVPRVDVAEFLNAGVILSPPPPRSRRPHRLDHHRLKASRRYRYPRSSTAHSMTIPKVCGRRRSERARSVPSPRARFTGSSPAQHDHPASP